MAKTKNDDSERKTKKKLRKSWLDGHPEVRAAVEAVERAQKLAEQPKWIADPYGYCSSARDAVTGVPVAKEQRGVVVDRLRGEFDRAVGLLEE
jgi:hypothetical protein